MTSRTSAFILALVAAAAVTSVSPLPQDAIAQEPPEGRTEYVVRYGDTLYGISRRFGTSVDELIRANQLAGDRIQIGQKLMIPAPPARADSVLEPIAADTLHAVDESVGVVTDFVSTAVPAPADTSVERQAVPDSSSREVELGYLDVHPGQSLYDIFLVTGLPVDSLLALNPDVETVFVDSFRLVVPAPYASFRYTVKRGDTLFKIARESGTTVAAIRAANTLSGDVIHIGQRLLVPSTRVAEGVMSEVRLPVVGEGEARLYPHRFVGRLTASGRPYDPEAFTISHGDLPIGSIVLLTGRPGGLRTFAEVTDRLPESADYVVDVSLAVLRALGSSEGSNLNVELRVVRFGARTQ